MRNRDPYPKAFDFVAWDEAAQQQSAAALLAYAQKNGMPALQQAVSGGQYTHPTGVFFGGTGPVWSRRTQTDLLTGWLASATKVAIIDNHTGLGPWGFGEQSETGTVGARTRS